MIATWMRLAIFEAMSQAEDRTSAFGSWSTNSMRWEPIDGLKDALARLRKFGGRCVLGFQSIAQVSCTYGQSAAQTIVENCGNTLILRCSGSENGGTSQFASRLIGDREIIQAPSISRQRSRGACVNVAALGARAASPNNMSTEPAVMPSELEQLPDLCGYLKAASSPQWLKVAVSACPLITAICQGACHARNINLFPTPTYVRKIYYVARTDGRCWHCGFVDPAAGSGAAARPRNARCGCTPKSWRVHASALQCLHFLCRTSADGVQSRLSGLSQCFRLARLRRDAEFVLGEPLRTLRRAARAITNCTVSSTAPLCRRASPPRQISSCCEYGSHSRHSAAGYAFDARVLSIHVAGADQRWPSIF